MKRQLAMQKQRTDTIMPASAFWQHIATPAVAKDSVPPIVHQVLRSPGQPLDSATRAFMEPRFRQDFSQVRVHTDGLAAKSAQEFGTKAYAAGSHIVFGSGLYAPTSQDGRELLGHELIHVAQSQRGARGIGFWSKDEHHKLTKVVAEYYRTNRYSPAIVRDPLFGGDQFYRIVDASFDMDVTPKRILVTGPRFGISHVPIVSPLGTKGEGPEHGEDDNYSRAGAQPGEVSRKARDQNVKLQEQYVTQALEFYRKEVTSKVKSTGKHSTEVTHPGLLFVNGKVQLTPNVEGMFRALGNACHVAQDRGAHWEGTKDMGHDDPRARDGSWSPDDPKDNDQGYVNALKNTYEVFRMWTWGTTMEIGYEQAATVVSVEESIGPEESR